MAIVILHRAALAGSPYHEWLSDAGEPLHLIVSAAKLRAFNESIDDLPPGAYAEVRVVEGYDMNGEVELAVLDIARRESVRAIVAHAEFDVERAARLRACLGIEGQTPESANVYRDKVAMKLAARAAGIPVADFTALEHAPGLLDFVRAHGLPVVLKPRNGAGSFNVSVLRDAEDVARLVRQGFTPPLDIRPNWMLESFVEGPTYHVDGLVLDGRIVLNWPSLYATPSLDYLDSAGEANASYLLSPDNPLTARLQDFVSDVVSTFPTPRNTTFHAEVFHTPDDRLVLCEIASRTGGARIGETLETCFGVNISGLWARAECGLPTRLPDAAAPSAALKPSTLGGWALIAPRPGRIERLPSHCPLPGVVDFALNVEPDRILARPKAATESIASIVFRTDSEADSRSTISRFRDWFSRECRIVEPA